MLNIDKIRRHNSEFRIQFPCIDRSKAKEIDVGSESS